jgi:hypothetical protein
MLADDPDFFQSFIRVSLQRNTKLWEYRFFLKRCAVQLFFTALQPPLKKYMDHFTYLTSLYFLKFTHTVMLKAIV